MSACLKYGGRRIKDNLVVYLPPETGMKRIIVLVLLITCCKSVLPQKTATFRLWEDSLISLRDEVMGEPDETARLALNEDFMTLLENVLQMQNSFKYTWDSVRNFSVLASPDNLFKIFTWHVPKDDYSTENFGFVQVHNEARRKYVLFPLYDKQNTADYPDTYIGGHNRWYGAVYYRLIPLAAKNTTYYTLLGWNGHDLFTNQKVIEVLHFSRDMTPVFGAHIFKNYPKRVSRVIFEYSKNAVQHLGYENQEYEIASGKADPKTGRPAVRRVATPMIIFNRLIPIEEGMDGMPAGMVPEASMNQGFVAHDGRWLFLEQVRGTNPDKPRPDYQYRPRQFYRHAINQ